MIVADEKETPANIFNHPDALNAKMKVLVGPHQGWSDYVMRMVELDVDGYTPCHNHDWPHINYIVEGNGILHVDGNDTEISSGSYAFIPVGAVHQFKNTGTDKLRFICIVPKNGHQ
ncbi:MAG: cupin domain-containing protein [Desulfobacteraceae bacterium]|jgi:quercetin dioxygenase-like cupin family protein